MCERCDERKRLENLSNLSNKSDGKIVELNRVVENFDDECKRIDAEIKQKHKEAIDGYDKQIEDCLRDLATFTTKMLIMFEDYRKKGDAAGMTTILKSISNYAIMTQTDVAVLVSSISTLISRMQP